jgi:hypothetical protein
LFGAIIVASALDHPRSGLATASEGYKSTLLAVGRFDEMDVFHASPHGLKAEGDEQLWPPRQEAQGPSDVYVQSNVWAPGGSTGWHSHPGHSFIIVTAGTLTDYEGHDPGCKPHVYKTGMGFVDPGGDHVHILRNEGNVEAKTIAVQLIPADAVRRIDVADPGNCHFWHGQCPIPAPARPGARSTSGSPRNYRRGSAARNRLRELFATLFRKKRPELTPEAALRIANVTVQVVKAMNPYWGCCCYVRDALVSGDRVH